MNKALLIKLERCRDSKIETYWMYVDGTYRASGSMFQHRPDHYSKWKRVGNKVMYKHNDQQGWADWGNNRMQTKIIQALDSLDLIILGEDE